MLCYPTIIPYTAKYLRRNFQGFHGLSLKLGSFLVDHIAIALLISTISLKQCYSKNLLWINISHSKWERFSSTDVFLYTILTRINLFTRYNYIVCKVAIVFLTLTSFWCPHDNPCVMILSMTTACIVHQQEHKTIGICMRVCLQ